MSVEPGAYTIQNVMHRNFAIQSQEDTVVGHAESVVGSFGFRTNREVNLLKLWSISRLDNDKYTVRNIETNHYAGSPSFPTVGGSVITTQNLQQWDIKETGVKGRYVIYTSAADIDLFWGLSNPRLLTPISLRDIPNTPSNQWELVKFDLWRDVGHLRAKLADVQNVATTLLGKHRSLQDDNAKVQDECTKLHDEHTKLQDEHTKLQDENTRLRDGAGRLNEDVRQERARHLQAEAELKAHYEQLLAEEVRSTECICM
ncbi:hypothetical protein BD410DRAFT_840788 [Rickenella mellea]|uniref:Ricin B lectin domain-containing protein n=1 Tax=Rickenella mellea TaxID=50990 RepID=A0A4Y7Q083_9AGAM|nr:hypothetical protein BD410DRAFT_840788 [Rickenella mellea]